MELSQTGPSTFGARRGFLLVCLLAPLVAVAQPTCVAEGSPSSAPFANEQPLNLVQTRAVLQQAQVAALKRREVRTHDVAAETQKTAEMVHPAPLAAPAGRTGHSPGAGALQTHVDRADPKAAQAGVFQPTEKPSIMQEYSRVAVIAGVCVSSLLVVVCAWCAGFCQLSSAVMEDRGSAGAPGLGLIIPKMAIVKTFAGIAAAYEDGKVPADTVQKVKDGYVADTDPQKYNIIKAVVEGTVRWQINKEGARAPLAPFQNPRALHALLTSFMTDPEVVEARTRLMMALSGESVTVEPGCNAPADHFAKRGVEPPGSSSASTASSSGEGVEGAASSSSDTPTVP